MIHAVKMNSQSQNDCLIGMFVFLLVQPSRKRDQPPCQHVCVSPLLTCAASSFCADCRMLCLCRLPHALFVQTAASSVCADCRMLCLCMNEVVQYQIKKERTLTKTRSTAMPACARVAALNVRNKLCLCRLPYALFVQTAACSVCA